MKSIPNWAPEERKRYDFLCKIEPIVRGVLREAKTDKLNRFHRSAASFGHVWWQEMVISLSCSGGFRMAEFLEVDETKKEKEIALLTEALVARLKLKWNEQYEENESLIERLRIEKTFKYKWQQYWVCSYPVRRFRLLMEDLREIKWFLRHLLIKRFFRMDRKAFLVEEMGEFYPNHCWVVSKGGSFGIWFYPGKTDKEREIAHAAFDNQRNLQ